MAPENDRSSSPWVPPSPELILELSPEPILIIDRFANLLWANPPAVEWSGWDIDELRAQPLIDLIHPDDQQAAIGALLTVQERGMGGLFALRFRAASGRYRHVEIRGRSALADPRVKGIVLVGRDLTDRRHWEVGAGDSRLLQAIIDHAPGITMLLGPSGVVRGISRALTTLTGRRLTATLGYHVRDLVRPADQAVVDAELARLVGGAERGAFEATVTSFTGGPHIAMNFNAVNLLDDDAVEGIIVTVSDITPIAQARQRLRYIATHDPLTGLPNRLVAVTRLQRALEESRTRPTSVSVVFCDLNDFKRINDTYGHVAGDEVLVEFASRLRRIVRGHDVAARIGGDEFLLVLERAGAEIAEAFAPRVEHILAASVTLSSGEEVQVTISLGFATGEGTESATDLLARADSAMYRAKPRRPDR